MRVARFRYLLTILFSVPAVLAWECTRGITFASFEINSKGGLCVCGKSRQQQATKYCQCKATDCDFDFLGVLHSASLCLVGGFGSFKSQFIFSVVRSR